MTPIRPEETFANHLTYLRENSWKVIDLAALLRGLSEPDSLPPHAALITFDDACRSLLEGAVPLLRRFGYPAVVFVPTDFIGGRNEFDAGNEPDEAICDWNDLRELEREGISVQSHTASHPHLSDLSPGARREEASTSKAILEQGLGKPVTMLSYPFNDPGQDPAALGVTLKHLGYRAACLYKGGLNTLPISNPYLLTRVAMGPDTDIHAELSLPQSEV